MNESALNCSEFVYKSFVKINRLGVGEVQTINDLNRDSFDGQLMKYWEMLTGGPVDENSKFLSPASIVLASSTEAIAANLPYDRILSDKEVFEGWSTNSALEVLDDQLLGLGSPEAVKLQLESLASETPYKKL